MFDTHLHSVVSFDGISTGEQMLLAAERAGLQEICFTDHIDYDPLGKEQNLAFDNRIYSESYDNLEHSKIRICRGMEFGMMPDNKERFQEDLKRRPFDFVLGSVHFVENLDIYYDEFWQDKTVEQAERLYLEQTLACVQLHDGFDVLAHLTYIGKVKGNPYKRPVSFDKHRELIEEILKTLVQKEKGLEINTSGFDRCGAFLPDIQYIRRFKELGGRFVTVGSDAHETERVGQYCAEACQLAKEVFGYVCTFRDRKPVFHKL